MVEHELKFWAMYVFLGALQHVDARFWFRVDVGLIQCNTIPSFQNHIYHSSTCTVIRKAQVCVLELLRFVSMCDQVLITNGLVSGKLIPPSYLKLTAPFPCPTLPNLEHTPLLHP